MLGLPTTLRHLRIVGVGLLMSAIASAFTDSNAHADEHWVDALREGSFSASARYRYEWVDQDGLPERAQASTLRNRLGWHSGSQWGWSAEVEVDAVFVLGAERFNSTENGRSEYPVVADPEGLDLNRAVLRHRRDGTTISIGRQRLNHSDQRFIGGVAWRQNEQTYDGARVQIQLSESLSLDGGWFRQVNRIFGPDSGAQPARWYGDLALISAKLSLQPEHQIEAFFFQAAFDEDNGPANSNATAGLRYTGSFGSLGIDASLAQQRDAGDNPIDYSALYSSLRLDWTPGPLTLSVGREELGSDGGNAGFRTPLATLHKFQGFADKFLGTPNAGVEDRYVGVRGNLGPVAVSLTQHWFDASDGNADYGTETNATANWKISKRYNVAAKLADYSSDGFATDTQKLMLTFVARL